MKKLRHKNLFLTAVLAVAVVTACSCAKTETSKPAEKTAPIPAAKPSSTPSEGPVFTCTSAGRWYPANPTELNSELDGYLNKAEKRKLEGRIIALIAPHAGYQFSAPVAAYAYKELEGLAFDTVVVVGFVHNNYDPGIAVYEKGAFRTPLGDIPIDSETTAALIAADPKIKNNPSMFVGEHSLDNQLPFLQKTLGSFKLVPILFGTQTPENITALANALAKVLKGKNALLVASTDMSHYWQQNEANKLDAETISHVKMLDAAGIATMMRDDQSGRKLCGYGAVQAVIRAAQALGADKAELLKHATSGDTYGDTGQGVVGYMAMALLEKNGKNTPAAKKTESDKPTTAKEKKMTEKFEGELDAKSEKELLGIARNALETYIKTGKHYDAKSDNPQLDLKRGVFVTLTENGDLRGCMGWFEQDMPLSQRVAKQAETSATGDPRFPRVQPSELSKINIEISVLSPPKYVDSYEDIVVGKHGVILEKGPYRATFLPQVAPEQGWDRDTMLSHLAMKAGLSPDGWRQGTRFQVYTAQVFGEGE